jgi:phospholipase C
MDHFVRAYESTCQAAKDHGDNDWNTDQIRLHSHNIMKCQPPENVPVLTTLARNYALCTNWFSSIPGPTLPNRLFAHLGTSVGRLDLSALDFEVPLTLYEVLDTSGISSTIYAGGWSVAATFARLMEHQDQYFGTLDDFYQDCADNDLPGYCFVEPRYGSEVVDDVFLPQNDQHPDSDLSAGDELIHSVYQAIQSRREIWESSVLIITYDEHGGIYDHRVPPAACAPDEHGSVDPKFDFTRYGVRVPAVVVSPYTPRGRLITEVCDHTSLIACARKLLTGAWDGSQYRITADQKLGRRAQRAYPLDKAFEFLQPKRPAGDVPIQFQPVRHSKMQPRPMNHLQSSLLNLAHSVNRGLPSHLQVKTPKTIETDQEVQHFLSHVYARAARFPTTKGRKS